jgi:hypothetical protein
VEGGRRREEGGREGEGAIPWVTSNKSSIIPMVEDMSDRSSIPKFS